MYFLHSYLSQHGFGLLHVAAGSGNTKLIEWLMAAYPFDVESQAAYEVCHLLSVSTESAHSGITIALIYSFRKTHICTHIDTYLIHFMLLNFNETACFINVK